MKVERYTPINPEAKASQRVYVRQTGKLIDGKYVWDKLKK